MFDPAGTNKAESTANEQATPAVGSREKHVERVSTESFAHDQRVYREDHKQASGGP